MNKKKVFMIGMPSSGKTTYLASLCRLLLYGEQEVEWKLDPKDVPDGFDKVGNFIKNLNSYKAVERTYGVDFYKVKFNLYNHKQDCIQFIVPDLSGEIFRDLVYDRRIPSNVMEQIIESDILLFFINDNTMIPEERIKIREKSAIKQLNEEQADKIIQNAENKVEEHAEDKEQIESKERDTNKEEEQKKYINQSALVELLQNIVYLVPHSLNVRFVISAWDLVEKEFQQDKVTPEEYIKIKLPLLYQYLLFNAKIIDYEIWGVSAQGGDFDDKDDLKKLQGDNGEDYVCVVDSKADTSKDLTKLL